MSVLIHTIFAWVRVPVTDYLFFFLPACASYTREQKRLLRGSIASRLVVGLKIDRVFVFELPFSSTHLPY